MAYANEYGCQKRKVMMIALGGIHSHHDDSLTYRWDSVPGSEQTPAEDSHTFECPVYMCQWSTVLLECQRYRRRLEAAQDANPRTCSDLRILADLTEFFERHKYHVLRWSADFNFAAMYLDEGWSPDLDFFHAASRQFQPA